MSDTTYASAVWESFRKPVPLPRAIDHEISSSLADVILRQCEIENASARKPVQREVYECVPLL